MAHRRGISLIEVLITLTFIAITSGAIFILHQLNGNGVNNKVHQESAFNYAASGIEIVRSLRSENFFNLADGTYNLVKAGNTYSLATNGEEILEDTYERVITIETVYRNDENNIDNNADSPDTQTKKITVTINYDGAFGNNQSLVLEEYLSDWSGVSWTQTTETHFNEGTTENTIITPSTPDIPGNGQIELTEILNNDLEYFETVDVFERAKDVAHKDGIIYAAIAKTNEGFCSTELELGDDDELEYEVLDCLDINGKGNGVVVSGNYAYVTVDSSSKGLAIINISNPNNLTLVKTVNIGSYGVDLAIQGNHLYVTTSKSNGGFVIVSVANPSTAFVASTSNIGSAGRGIVVNGNYAYVCSNNSKLYTYLITNPNSPQSQSNISLGSPCSTGAYQASYLYLPIADSDNGLKVVNVATPTAPFVVDSYDLGEDGKGADIYDDRLYVTIDNNHAGLKIFSITDPLNLEELATIDIQGKGEGIDVTEGYGFIATDTSSQGVAVITTGNLALAESGSYTSKVYDTGTETTNYKQINWIATIPANTTLKFQIRTASSNDPGTIDSATFVGPDGTNQTYYETSPAQISLDPNATGYRYLQWIAYFTSDGNSSPILEDLTIKYLNENEL